MVRAWRAFGPNSAFKSYGVRFPGTSLSRYGLLDRVEEKASCISELIEVLERTRKEWGARRLWHRGLEDEAYELQPTAYREAEDFSETSAFNVFWAQGRGLAEFSEIDYRDEWSWYFAARHYGIPTRLLDWSANALVALLFAVKLPDGKKEYESENAALWLLDPTDFNEKLHGSDSIVVPCESADDKAWLPGAEVDDQAEGGKNGILPVALYPSQTNVRLVAQAGMFTVHGRARDSLDSVFSSSGVNARRVQIPGGSRGRILEELGLLGLDPWSLYPEAPYLAQRLTSFYRGIASSANPNVVARAK